MRSRFTLLLLVALLAAACGDAATTTTQPPTTVATAPTSVPAATAPSPVGFPVTVDTATGSLTIDARPTRIVSLSSTATEMLFAIGAGDQVAAVDEFSNFPPEAPITDLSGFQPNLEAIAEFDPDLVVIAFDPGDLESGLAAIGIPTLAAFAAVTIDDTYAQLELLGAVTGNVDGAEQVVGGMKADIAAIVAALPDVDGEVTYYHELDPTLYSVTSATFVGELYGLLGLANVADAADPDGYGYPQLSPEYVIEQDPDLIFLADTKCCAESASTLSTRPGWDQLTAVQSGKVVELDDDIASRWGPRIVDYLAIIAAAVADLGETGA